MAKCLNCKRYDRKAKWCETIDDSPDEDFERCCDVYEKMTNADRIRSMSDEDLAMNMMCPNENGLAEIDCDKCDNCNCYECLLKWLQSEVEE